MRSLVEVNAFCHGPDTRPGLMVNGGACQGKTETVCEALACFEDEWLGPLRAGARQRSRGRSTTTFPSPTSGPRSRPPRSPPASGSWTSTARTTRACGWRTCCAPSSSAVCDHGTKALAIDDMTRLKLHREADQDVLDLIRELMSLPVTLILIGVGIPKSGLLRDGRRDPATGQWLFPPVKDRGKSRNDDAPGQTDLRFDLVDLDRFSYGGTDGIAAWIAHLVGIEQQLRLLHGRDGMLSGGDMPEHLFRRTGGTVGLLRKLIQKACRQAIETGNEEITAGLLDTLALSPQGPARTRPRLRRDPRHPRRPGREEASQAPQAEEHRLRRPRRPRRRDRGLTAMPQPRPLPRSLAPLPGESLPGFLLRLSCRLGQPPARIAELTGLAPDRRSRASLPVTLLAGIPAPATGTFTFMTRLDAGQVAQLGMSAWRERYAPVVISGPEHDGTGWRRRLNSELVLAPVTRYCPDCLAGDGSAIQESFGGPWLKTWHLPVVFACPAHQRLLEHLCPECGQPVREPRPGTQFSLLPAMRAAALHPAQCRTELAAPGKGSRTPPGCCGARLDQTGSGGRPARGWPPSKTRSWAFSHPVAAPAR